MIGSTAGLMAASGSAETFLSGPGFAGVEWALPLLIPPLAALVAFLATRRAAFATLRERP